MQVDVAGDAEVTERLLTHLRSGTTEMTDTDLRLPVWHYTDPDRAAAERAAFRRHPLAVAASSSLKDPGAFLTTQLLGVPLLLVRQDDGSVAGFRNVCRHRGGMVEPESCGSKRVFTCRYHGWTYDRHGGLRNIPFSEGFATVDPACHGLRPVGTAERHGLVWVELDGTGPPDIGAWLGPELEAQIGPFGLATWELHLEETFTHDMNWKLVADGVLDILHPKFLHPDTVGKLIQTNTHAWDRYGHHGRLAMARRKLERLHDDVPPGTDPRKYVITNFFIYPNTMLILQPDHFELWTIFPDAESPLRSRTTIRFLIPEPPRNDEDRNALTRSWDILRTAVTTEDWPMAGTIQVAAQAVGDRSEQFIYGRCEVPIQHLHRRLAEDLEAVNRTEIHLGNGSRADTKAGLQTL